MKDVRFRAWIRKENAMYMVKKLEFDGELSKVIVEKGGKMVEYLPREVELMQYTGIRDNDGTEIYEGDIVKVLGKENQLFGYIWYNGYYFTVNLHNVPGADNWPIMKEENIKSMDVIGNIYENSTLIKPK